MSGKAYCRSARLVYSGLAAQGGEKAARRLASGRTFALAAPSAEQALEPPCCRQAPGSPPKSGLAEHFQGIDSDFATFIRTLVILAALALFLTWAGKWQGVAAFTARNWLFLVLSGLATGASWLAYFKALQLGDASRVAPVDKFSLVLVALLAVVFLGERPRPHEWGGLGLVAAGVLVLAIKR